MKKSILLYVVFLALFDIFSYAFIDPNLIYLKPLYTGFFLQFRLATTIIYTTGICIFFCFYLYFLIKIHKKQFDTRQVFQLIGISVIMLIFSYPAMVSFDIFNYIATAKVTFFYHENPYIVMPIEFIRDPLLLFMHAANKVALYAPFWILLTGIPFILGAGNFLLTLLLFKCFIALGYLGTVYLLWKMTKDVVKTAYFALNTLVIIETLVSGHNDIVMMGLLLLSFYFLFEKRRVNTMLFFVLSAAIKYATLILFPIYIFYFVKRFSKHTVLFLSTLCMYCMFFLSSFREEIYPWYALWFLLPSSLLFGKNALSVASLSFSCSLLLRYIPYMFLGTYAGITPFLKTLLTFLPVVITLGSYYLQKPITKIVNLHAAKRFLFSFLSVYK